VSKRIGLVTRNLLVSDLFSVLELHAVIAAAMLNSNINLFIYY